MKYKFNEPIQGTIGTVQYACTIEWRNGSFISDEPESSGGKASGPDPHSLLLAAVVSCTLVTLRMYIDRKGWTIDHIAVDANLFQQQKEDKLVTVIDRDIRYLSPVTNEQRERLTEIASACPISKVLQGDVSVRTYAYNDDPTEKKMNYTNGEVTVVWKPNVCTHSARCVTQLPSVFNTKEHPWINMQGAATDDIIRQVNRCPTGALSYFRNAKHS